MLRDRASILEDIGDQNSQKRHQHLKIFANTFRLQHLSSTSCSQCRVFFLTKFKVLCCTLFLGMIITGFMKEDNRRQAADQERANSIVTSQLLESKSNREDFSEKI